MNSTLVVLAQCTNFSAILVLLHPTSGYSEVYFYFEIHSEFAEIHVEQSNLINEHALNREPVPLMLPMLDQSTVVR